MLLEGSGRVNNGITLHLKSVQRKGNTRVVVSMAAGRGMGMIESVFMKVQICVAADARDVGREVGGSLASLEHVC